jgi:hypothetical protein
LEALEEIDVAFAGTDYINTRKSFTIGWDLSVIDPIDQEMNGGFPLYFHY